MYFGRMWMPFWQVFALACCRLVEVVFCRARLFVNSTVSCFCKLSKRESSKWKRIKYISKITISSYVCCVFVSLECSFPHLFLSVLILFWLNAIIVNIETTKLSQFIAIEFFVITLNVFFRIWYDIIDFLRHQRFRLVIIVVASSPSKIIQRDSIIHFS